MIWRSGSAYTRLEKQKGTVKSNAGNKNALEIAYESELAGTTMLITPVQFEQNFLLDGIMAIVAAVLLWVCSVRKKKLTRPGGIVMLAVDAGYFAYIMYKNYMEQISNEWGTFVYVMIMNRKSWCV